MIELRILGPIELVGGRDPGSILRHPRELSILAYLAVKGATGSRCTREELLALFWPESDDRRARNALNQALHRIRSATDDHVLASRVAQELGLETARVATDVARFRAALANERHEAALAVYRGPLLEGFHLQNSGAFERWVDRERKRLRAAARDAGRTLRDAAGKVGDLETALHWARRTVELSAREERDVRRLIQLLSQSGDGVSARRAYEEFEQWMASELGLAPSPETVALVECLPKWVPSSSGSSVPGLAPESDDERLSGPSSPVNVRAEAAEPRTPGSGMAVAGTRLPEVNHPRRARAAWLLAIAAASLLAALSILPPRIGTAGAGTGGAVSERAHSFYERGQQYVLDGVAGGGRDRQANWNLAVDMFRQAADLAPNFAPAHAELGMTHLRVFHWGFDRSTQRQVLAKSAIDRGLELAPDLPEVSKAAGYYHLWSQRDYAQALEAGRRAHEVLRDDPEVLTLVFAASRRLGRAPEAIPLLEQVVELTGPRAGPYRAELVATYMGLRDYRQAQIVLDGSLALFPDHGLLLYQKFLLALLSSGDLVAGWRALDTARERLGPARTWPMEFGLHWLARDYDKALAVLDRREPATFHIQQGDFPVELMYGLVHRLAGRGPTARDFYVRALPDLRAKVSSRPDEPWFHGWLAVALAGAGQADTAMAEAKLAGELAELEPDRWENPYLAQEVLVHVFIMAGEHDRAIELIGQLLESRHYRAISTAWVRLDPRFDPLRADSRFRAIMMDNEQGAAP